MDKELVNKTVENIVKDYLRPTTDMTLFSAKELSKKVRQKAKEMGINIVVAISNKAGQPVLVEVMDNAFIASYDIAVNKTFTSASLKMSTKELSNLAAPGGSLYGIQFTNQGKIVIFGGGDVLLNKNNEIVGAIGVSGGTEEQDTYLSKYGKEIFERI